MAIIQRLNTATIREIYKLFGMSLQQYSEGIGIPKSTLSGWASKDKYYVEYLVLLCNFLRIPLSSLLLKEGEEEYVDRQIRQKVLPEERYATLSYLRERVRLRVKKSSKERFGIDLIADAAGFSRATLYMMMGEAVDGKKRIIGWTDFRYLAAFSQALQVPLEDFFQGSFYADRVQMPGEIVIQRLTPRDIISKKEDNHIGLESRVESLEKELSMQRALLAKMNETLHLLASSLAEPRGMTSEDASPYSAPPGVVSREPDTATSAVKSM